MPLAQLAGYDEAPGTGGWTLRSSLVRFAQPEPVRASAVLELVRRIDAALVHAAREAPRGGDGRSEDAIRTAVQQMTELGGALTEWATSPSSSSPNSIVDRIARNVVQLLDDAGIERESRDGQRRSR